jgi:uncharacterized membrane protein
VVVLVVMLAVVVLVALVVVVLVLRAVSDRECDQHEAARNEEFNLH